MIPWIIPIWRRFFGGYDCKYDVLEKRDIQCVFLMLLVCLWEYFDYAPYDCVGGRGAKSKGDN